MHSLITILLLIGGAEVFLEEEFFGSFLLANWVGVIGFFILVVALTNASGLYRDVF